MNGPYGAYSFEQSGRTGAGLRDHHPQIPGKRVSGGGDSAAHGTANAHEPEPSVYSGYPCQILCHDGGKQRDFCGNDCQCQSADPLQWSGGANPGGASMKIDLPGLLFPRRCPICHEIVENPGELACDICKTRLQRVRAPWCQRCGKPLIAHEQEYCGDCSRKTHVFRKGRAAFVYDETMRRSIARFKYDGTAGIRGVLCGRDSAGLCAGRCIRWKAEALVPIPLHPSRQTKKRL